MGFPDCCCEKTLTVISFKLMLAAFCVGCSSTNMYINLIFHIVRYCIHLSLSREDFARACRSLDSTLSLREGFPLNMSDMSLIRLLCHSNGVFTKKVN